MKRNTFDPRTIVFLGTYRKMLVFYFWHGRYCVRTVSTLSGKRVKKAPEFKVTMQYAKRLGRASKIASKIYRQLPDGWKLHYLYRKMTGVGTNLLKEREHTPEELEIALWQYLASVGFKAEEHSMIHPMPAAIASSCILSIVPPYPSLSPCSFDKPALLRLTPEKHARKVIRVQKRKRHTQEFISADEFVTIRTTLPT
ncbi:MAG: hypothetical protein QM731_17935 [Chitinophagaceae bacterium]